MMGNPDVGTIRLTADDLYLFNEGSHANLYRRLGAHPASVDGVDGYAFAVWAPNAERVSVVGDFNGWNARSNRLEPQGVSGIWHAFVPGVGRGRLYKYAIRSRHRGHRVQKADPFAFLSQVAPETASVTWALDYEWNDGAWMESRAAHSGLDAPMSIYEMHLGSWRHAGGEHRSLSYRELAEPLADHLAETGFTHVEFMPLMEHPFYGSWGYQTAGYFAATSRYGDPQDLMYLVDYLHQRGFGVILDWVPSHFPTDEHGLGFFDGTHLYEHADPRRGFHPDWKSYVFNYGRNEVRSFLLSSAHFWLDAFHADGLRVDAVASMLYRDYSRKEGEWIPNEHGGREDLEAIAFLRQLNESVYGRFPGVQMIAEESTAWPMVSRPTYLGGLGFGLKWDMGWMHDTLTYFRQDPIHRRYHHSKLSFRGLYAFNENFLLPLSHDEVVHGKRSLLEKMPGDDWQKFANLRLLLSYMWATPGKKLLFMGAEFGQRREWNFDTELDWGALASPAHGGLQRLVKDLNHLYRSRVALHELDCDPGGFEWIDIDDAENSTVSVLRKSRGGEMVVAVFNLTPVPRANHRVGVPHGGHWREILNSDAPLYGGSGQGNLGGLQATPVAAHGRPASLVMTLPPLGAVFFVPDGN